jgi:hypothetical protein
MSGLESQGIDGPYAAQVYRNILPFLAMQTNILAQYEELTQISADELMAQELEDMLADKGGADDADNEAAVQNLLEKDMKEDSRENDNKRKR